MRKIHTQTLFVVLILVCNKSIVARLQQIGYRISRVCVVDEGLDSNVLQENHFHVMNSSFDIEKVYVQIIIIK